MEMLQQVKDLKVVEQPGLEGLKIFADGASLEDFVRLYHEGLVTGFTTNPTLMRRFGVTDYEAFAKALLAQIRDYPISFEVFSDDLQEMKRQARKIAGWGANIYVKIPITNTKGESCLPIVTELSREGIRCNVTALMTLEQVSATVEALAPETPAIISIFAGRIADTGQDPVPVMRAAVAMAAKRPLVEILWASVREVLNLYQAKECGCHIITSTTEVIKKIDMYGKNLDDLSLETVDMFYKDALKAGYTL
jgi:transaldolase